MFVVSWPLRLPFVPIIPTQAKCKKQNKIVVELPIVKICNKFLLLFSYFFGSILLREVLYATNFVRFD